MASWSEMETEAPDFAAFGRRLFYRTNEGLGLLATVRGDLPPRIHPINVEIVDGHLLAFIHDDSAKGRDMVEDGRYALHAHQDPQEPHEFQVRGHVTVIRDEDRRRRAAEVWPFSTNETYLLVEMDIEHALIGERATADDWPPKYRSWRPDSH
jgi:hypothetical protein